MDKYTLYFIEWLLYVACIFFLYNTMLMSLNARASLAYKLYLNFLNHIRMPIYILVDWGGVYIDMDGHSMV